MFLVHCIDESRFDSDIVKVVACTIRRRFSKMIPEGRTLRVIPIVTREKEAYKTICSKAEDLECCAVVMGTRGLSTRRMAVGSVAGHVLKICTKAVCLVK